MIKTITKLFIPIYFIFAMFPARAGMPVIDAAVLAAINIMSSTLNTSITGMNSALNASITGMNTNLGQLLYQLGVAINQNGGKIAGTIEAASKSQRDFQIAQEKSRRLYESKQRHEVPKNICSESASGGAVQITQKSNSTKGSLRPGGGGNISSSSIAQAINSPAQSQDIDSARAAKIHSEYCDADDYASYGGSTACPVVSSLMPGADKRLDSLLYGAGPDGKKPDLTFSQKQIDVARMYTQNSIRRSIGTAIKKGEADSVAGSQYIGLMNQYNSIISAASDPQDTLLANSMPNPATKTLLNEALKSPSAKAFYTKTVSVETSKTGVMSTREFDFFEVGRRYANTEYNRDLQEMNSDNLLREQIRVLTLNNWLLLSLKDEVQKGNILSGQILASMARQEFEPLLTLKYNAVSGSLGGK